MNKHPVNQSHGHAWCFAMELSTHLRICARQSRRAHPCIPRMPQWSAQGSYELALSISPPITGRPCYLKKKIAVPLAQVNTAGCVLTRLKPWTTATFKKKKKTCALRKNARWYQRASPRSPRWNQYGGISSTPAYIIFFWNFHLPPSKLTREKYNPLSHRSLMF